MAFKNFNSLQRVIVVFILLLVLDYLWLNDVVAWFVRALSVESTPLKAGIFFGSYLLMILSAAVLLISKNISFPFFITSLVAVCTCETYAKINGEPFGVLDIETALRYLDFANQAAKTYWRPLLLASATAGIPYIILYLFIRKFVSVVPIRWAGLAVSGLAVGFILTFRSAGNHTRAFPRYVQPLFVSGFYLRMNPYVGPRLEPLFAPKTAPLAKHVIFIMDESVRGDLLGINGFAKETTPFLFKNKQLIQNYGIASSLSNSSSSSNYGVITGLKMEHIPDRIQHSRKAPLIFDYGLKAMEEVHLVWGQTSFAQQKQKFEFNKIKVADIYGDRPNLPVHQYDREVINQLDDITEKSTTQFIWVNKWGSHFDYDSTYPKEERAFTPTYTESAADDQAAMLNSYYNSLRWGVDGFFAELIKRLEGRDVILIYSSDHGQSILEKGIPGTHNRVFNISSSQASVPLFALGFNTHTRDLLAKMYIKENFNKASAEQIFPSLLLLMGYAREDLKSYYANSLFEPLAPIVRKFLSGDLWGFGPAISNIFAPQADH